MSDYEKEYAEKVRDLYKQMSNLANKIGMEKVFVQTFAEEMQRDHRTLQATIIRQIQGILVNYGKNIYHDLRNEAAVKFAAEVEKLIKEKNLYVPFI